MRRLPASLYQESTMLKHKSLKAICVNYQIICSSNGSELSL